MKLLLAEDDRDISSVIVKFLQKNNYLVDAVYDGKEALQYLDYEKYDGVILDVMMPKMDGITVVRNMRKKGDNTPVLILTAKAEIDDKVLGLDAGADDYLTKPFSMKEFLARIRALTRRKNTTLSTFSFGNIILNPKTYEIISQTDKVRLSAKEYQVMEILINNSNSLVSTEMLMDKVWGFDSDAEINVVWVYISALRKKLQAINANLTISAIRGLGYKLEEK
ncbi:MAG: response regulator transcription factor [Bacilli bacterium]|nr:response regulator transcription factor [Bacilli bacterium]